jgi:hypothetical protein
MPNHRVRARQILNSYYPQISSEGSIRKERNMHGESADWWLAATPPTRWCITVTSDIWPRTRTWRARRKTTSGPPGLSLEDDYLWYDRAVMATLLKHGCIERRNERFEITDSGRQLLEKETSQTYGAGSEDRPGNVAPCV